MDERAVWSTFDAEPGCAAEVEAFLRDCADRIAEEPGTTTFFALRLGNGRYATFAAFASEAALAAHKDGPTAAAVKARAADLFASGLAIVPTEVVAAKPPAGAKGGG